VNDLPGGSPVEDYLDELVTAMAGRSPRELRSMLAEAEAHLRDDVESAVGRGVPRHQAEAQAVARFGPVQPIADAELDRGRPPLHLLVRQLVRSAVLLAGVGSVAVGASGLVAGAIRLFGGARALVAVAPGQTLTASDCARWLHIHPDAGSCHAAAITDWADETVAYRVALGVMGLLILVGYRWLRKASAPMLLVRAVSDTVAVTAFGAAAVWTLARGVDAAVVGGGSGQWFSATPVALVAAAMFARRLLNDLRRPLDAAAAG
jgi:hypothetical protein